MSHQIEIPTVKRCGNLPTISVVIPTLNESTFLPLLLDALRKQTYPPLEIIIADAGSMDDTRDLAKEMGVTVIEGGMPSFGRNAGAKIAKGEYFLFLDADVVPPEDFMEQMAKKVKQNDFDVATCFISSVDDQPLHRVLCKGSNVYFWLTRTVSPHAPGFCIISRRSIHEKMGGFDESLTISEDTDYARRAHRIGKFGIISDTRIPVSMRRVEKEGLIGLGLKYGWCELHSLVNQPVRKKPFVYEFGNFGDGQSLAPMPVVKIRLIRQSLMKMIGLSIYP